MPKLGIFSGEEVCRLLEQEGFQAIRQRDSHRIMQRRLDNQSVTVPIPLHKVVRVGTLSAIIRQSGVSRDKFVR